MKSSDYFNTRLTPIQYGKNSWTVLNDIEQSIKNRIEKIGIPLKDWDVKIYRGILTGYNEAFIIDKKTKDKLINDSPKNAEIIRPILRGRDIRKYKEEWNNLWLINTHNGQKSKGINKIDVLKDYPNIHEHLLKYAPEIEKRSDKGDHWTNLRNCTYLDAFDCPKIIYPGLMRISKTNDDDFPRFYYDEKKGYRFTNDTYFMIGENLKFLLALLNSKLTKFLFPFYMYSFDTDGYKVFTEYLEKIPFILVSEDNQIPFINLVDEILDKKRNNKETLLIEKKLNSLIYKLYELTPEEIEYIETN